MELNNKWGQTRDNKWGQTRYLSYQDVKWCLTPFFAATASARKPVHNTVWKLGSGLENKWGQTRYLSNNKWGQTRYLSYQDVKWCLTPFLKLIPAFGDRVLRVIYNATKEPPLIVTVYFDRTMKGKL